MLKEATFELSRLCGKCPMNEITVCRIMAVANSMHDMSSEPSITRNSGPNIENRGKPASTHLREVAASAVTRMQIVSDLYADHTNAYSPVFNYKHLLIPFLTTLAQLTSLLDDIDCDSTECDFIFGTNVSPVILNFQLLRIMFCGTTKVNIHMSGIH